MAVFRRTALPRLRLRPTLITWLGMGSKPLQSSKTQRNTTYLWYEVLRGETGLATSTPLLKLGEIRAPR